MTARTVIDRLTAFALPAAAFRYGRDLDERGEQIAAFRQYSRAARRGYREAEYRVGRCYLAGEGVPRSLAHGEHWVKRAAEHGLADAQALMAALCLNGKASRSEGLDQLSADRLFAHEATTARDAADFNAAMDWSRRAAKAGSAAGQALLAYILTSGPEELCDPDTAHHWYRRAAKAGCAQGHLGYALSLAARSTRDEERKEVVEHLLAAAGEGLPTALYLLGVLLACGVGVTKDASAALGYWRQAAAKGHPEAQFRLGCVLLQRGETRQDRIDGETWLRRAALAGHTSAAVQLGRIYGGGDDQQVNHAEAAKWYQHAAEAGDPVAARALASLYVAGVGVRHDPTEAGRWLRRAVVAGNAEARVDLGNLVLRGLADPQDVGVLAGIFELPPDSADPVEVFNCAVSRATGIGSQRDDAEAASLMRQAAEHFPKAQFLYGKMLADGRGVPHNLAEARIWIERAAATGLVEAKVALGEMLMNAKGGARSLEAAQRLFEEAASKGHGGAMFALGALYSGASNPNADPVVALQWFRRAAQGGHGFAQWIVARYLATGTGTEVDRKEAADWLARAAAQGVAEAEAELRATPLPS